MTTVPFQFYMPMVDLEKSEDGHMFFGGFSSSEARDLEGEDVIQKGLDFSEFVSYGWFNDNHTSGLMGGGVVGVPVPEQGVTWLQKGEPKPLNQEPADRSGWYVQGELLDTEEGRSIWDKACALRKTLSKRHLGMSLEGEVVERDGPKILKAKVRNIALTEKPVNRDTTMEVLTKAFTGEGPWSAEGPSPETELLREISGKLDAISKALVAGSDIDNPDPNPRVVGQGGKTPEPTKKALTAGAAIDAPTETTPGDGFALRQEDLDGQTRTTTYKTMDGGSYGQDFAVATAMAKEDDSDMAHDGIHGGMKKVDPYYMKKAAPEPEDGLWTPEMTDAHLKDRYPHMSDSQRSQLVSHMFSHLGGT
jgi:hypothetical protein